MFTLYPVIQSLREKFLGGPTAAATVEVEVEYIVDRVRVGGCCRRCLGGLGGDGFAIW